MGRPQKSAQSAEARYFVRIGRPYIRGPLGRFLRRANCGCRGTVAHHRLSWRNRPAVGGPHRGARGWRRKDPDHFDKKSGSPRARYLQRRCLNARKRNCSGSPKYLILQSTTRTSLRRNLFQRRSAWAGSTDRSRSKSASGSTRTCWPGFGRAAEDIKPTSTSCCAGRCKRGWEGDDRDYKLRTPIAVISSTRMASFTTNGSPNFTPIRFP